MPIIDDLKALLAAFEPDPKKREEIKRLQEFIARVKAEGLAIPREYDLPPLDTIGRSLSNTKPDATA